MPLRLQRREASILILCKLLFRSLDQDSFFGHRHLSLAHLVIFVKCPGH